MWKGEDVIRHHAERCTGCLRCVEQCQFGAITSEARRTRLRVDRAACWGCGICRTVCPPGALSLEPRHSSPDVATAW
jgi:ferredoxin